MLCDFKLDYAKMPYMLENDGIVVSVNDIFLNLTGFNKEELLNMNISYVWKHLLRLNVQLNSITDETEVILFTKSLDVRFVNLHKYNSNKGNESLYVFSEKVDSRIENKFQFLNRLINDNKIGFAIYTVPDLIIIKANEAYLNFIPKPYNDTEFILGESIKKFRTDFKESYMEKALSQIIKSNKSSYCSEVLATSFGYPNLYWDTQTIPIVEDGKVKYVVSMLEDVTERVLSREHIALKNKQLEAIFESSNELIQIFDKNGQFISGRNLSKEIHDYIKTNGLNNVQESAILTDWNGGKVESKDSIIKKILNGETFNQIKIKVEVIGLIRYCELSGKPIYDKNGDIINAFMVTRDVTEDTIKMKLIEEQNKELEKALVMKDEFISLISHEFKTPLNVIYSAIQLIENVYFNQIPDHVKNFIGNIKQNTFRQLRLVNNLLDTTKINSGQFKLKMKNIDIVFLTKEIIESVKLYANQKNIKLSFISNLKCKTINIDDEKYERIILNLLSNAIKFTQKEGEITVILTENKVSNMLKIQVKDTGIGIPKDKQKLIFDKFGQVDSNLSRQAEGTGIGLSLVKSLVSIMEGTLQLESELDVGITFIVNFPAKEIVAENTFESCLDIDNRLIQSINVEFSDIYL